MALMRSQITSDSIQVFPIREASMLARTTSHFPLSEREVCLLSGVLNSHAFIQKLLSLLHLSAHNLF